MREIAAFTPLALLDEDPSGALYRGRAPDGTPTTLKVALPAARARLRREYDRLRSLEGAAVVRALGLVEAGDALALVLEELGGPTLGELLRSGPLAIDAALELGASLADALTELHGRGVVHRAIEPRRVVVRPGGAVLLGLGDADEVAEASAYLSPEQSGRTGRGVDHRSDLYSLGATLYEALTGQPPFVGDAIALIHGHLARAPRPALELRPELPPALAALVERLLHKSPEERYQDATALAADLRHCLALLRGDEDPDWEPGDPGAELRPPRRLHGREPLLAALIADLARVQAGAHACVALLGEAGAGKSALLDALRRDAAAETWLFGVARGEPGAAGVPFASLARALGELVRHLLGETSAALARWRERLSAALGAHASALAGLVPELALLLGEGAPAPELGPVEAQNRLALAVDELISVFAAAEHPLALVIDDAHRADEASLRLLERVLAGPTRHLLVLLAARPEELERTPLAACLGRLRGAATLRPLTLAPLSEGDLGELLADVTGDDADELRPLARIVRDKAGGNPFATGQFLRAARDAGHLRWDLDARRWRADLGALAAAEVSAKVAELMASALSRLPPSTCAALELAALIGPRFDLATLAELRGGSARAARDDLRPARRAGLIVPLGDAVRFVHERVRQAAYARLDDEERRARHLQLGRILLARAGDAPTDRALFEITDHLGRGAAALPPGPERRLVAALDLRAGLLARSATDFASARGLLAAAAALLDDDDPLSFEVHLHLAECEGLCGRHEDAGRRLAALAASGRPPADLARASALQVTLCSLRAEFAAALAAGREGLARLGVELPAGADALATALARERAEVDAALAGRPFSALGDAPRLADPEVQRALELLVQLGPATYFLDRALFRLVVITRVRLGLQRGHSGLSPYSYATYGLVLAEAGRYDEARDLFDLALALADPLGSPAFASKLFGAVALGLHFSRPLRDKLPFLRRAEAAGRAAGDLIYLSYARYNVVLTRLSAGDDLAEVGAEIEAGRAMVAWTHNPLARAMISIAGDLVRALTGEAVQDPFLGDPPAPAAACWYFSARLALRVFTGDLPDALAALPNALAWRGPVTGQHFVTELSFFACLALHGADEAARAAHAELLAACQDEVARWADVAPANYRHMHLLLRAEAARAAGEDGPARELYDRSVDAALAAGMGHHAALANARAAAHYLALGRPRLARVYLHEARRGYLQWGATAVAAGLARRHPELAAEARADPARPSLDLLSVIKASDAFARELELGALLDKVMRIVVENAGAERGVLLLEEAGELAVMAAHAVDGAGAADDAPRAVAYEAHRTGTPVILADAAVDPRFARDPYVRARAPRSILCAPIVHQTKSLGVLYLENNLSAGAFTRERVDVLTLLAAQVAISIEQTRLFARLEAARAAAEAASRTKSVFLANMSHELRTPLNAIIGYAELLTELAAEAGDDVQLADLGKIRGAGRHLLAVISDILDISKIEAGMLALADEVFDGRELVDEVVAALTHAIEQGGNTLVVDADPSLARLRGDPTRLRQVLFNLLSNAAKFTERGSVTLRAGRGHGRLWFSVTDTGIGIPLAEQARIFEAFVQVDGSSTRRQGGTGLGLTITRRLCRLMGGEIRVDSEPGRGSTFTVELPHP